MVYEKNTWQSGDVITSAKLNNMENGLDTLNYFVINAVFNPEDEGHAFTDATNAQVKAAHDAGRRIFVDGMIEANLSMRAEVTSFTIDTEGNLEMWTASAVVPDYDRPTKIMIMQGMDNYMGYRIIPEV